MSVVVVATTGSTSAGGIYNNTTLPILSNTIVAGNSSARPDLSGSFSSAGYNLIGDATGSSGFSDGVSGDQVGSSGSPIDPLLATLADNGGATQTHALLPGSPAIDAGDPSTNWDIGSACPAQDQRGYGRTGACDIGSFEFEGNPTAVTLSSPSVSSPGPRGDIQPGIFISVSLLLGILSLQTLRRLHRSTLFN